MAIRQADILEWIKTYAHVLAQNRDTLTQLDSAIGDADHGANMDRGFQAVMSKMADMSGQDIGSVFKTVGMTLLSTVGGAAGPLYGTLFLQLGSVTTGKMELSLEEMAAGLEAGVGGVQKRGKAEPGDKTMIDALAPALDVLKSAAAEGRSISEAFKASAEAAKSGMEATIPLVARKGRASYLGERSAGHQDPGATSSYLLIQSAADVLKDNP
jgi:dihydroxyacetone kinase-like protein